MTWIIIQFIVNFFQSFVLYNTLDMFYERKIQFKYFIELVIAANTILLSIININYSIATNPMIFLGNYILLVIFNMIIFKGNPISKIVTIFLMIALIGVSELIAASLIWLIADIDLNTINERSFGRLLAIIISQTLIMCIYFVLKKRINKVKMNLNNNIYYFLIGSIMIFTVVIIMTVIGLYGKFPNNEDIATSLVILTMCVSLLSLFSIVLTNKIVNDMEEKHRLDLELQHIKLDQKYLSDVNSALEEIRILRHDMRGELAIIYGYNELNQRDKIRSHIEKKLNDMDVQLIPKLDNDNIVTSFLNFKIKEAQSKNIRTEIQSNLSADKIIYIDKEDICKVLNNVLSNAIEACKNYDEKYIKLLFNIVNDYFIVIKCVNSFSGEIISDGSNIKTLKEDKSKHGYGFKSIKGIVEKYNGCVNIEYHDNEFTIEIHMLNKAKIPFKQRN